MEGSMKFQHMLLTPSYDLQITSHVASHSFLICTMC